MSCCFTRLNSSSSKMKKRSVETTLTYTLRR